MDSMIYFILNTVIKWNEATTLEIFSFEEIKCRIGLTLFYVFVQ